MYEIKDTELRGYHVREGLSETFTAIKSPKETITKRTLLDSELEAARLCFTTYGISPIPALLDIRE